MTDEKMVEEMARAIDPDTWKLRDEDLQRRKEWDAGIKLGWGEKTFEEWANRFVGKSLEAAQAAAAIAQGRIEELTKALAIIFDATNPDDPASYRADDREGCLDAVHARARAALNGDKS